MTVEVKNSINKCYPSDPVICIGDMECSTAVIQVESKLQMGCLQCVEHKNKSLQEARRPTLDSFCIPKTPLITTYLPRP